jgi:hypothetical protein
MLSSCSLYCRRWRSPSRRAGTRPRRGCWFSGKSTMTPELRFRALLSDGITAVRFGLPSGVPQGR